MRTTMQRRMAQTEILCAGVQIEEGGAHTENLEPVIVPGKLNEKQALKLVQAKFKKEYTHYVIINLEHSEKLFELSLEQFLEHATEVGE